jgi:hypothetical protein
MTQDADMRQAVASLDDSTDFSDPNTYAKLLGGGGEDEVIAANPGDEQGDSSQDTQTDDAQATSGQAPKADSGSTPDATKTTQTEPTKVDGVLTRDGKTVIPYAVLEGERTRARQAEKRAEAMQADIEQMKAQLAGAATKTPDPDALEIGADEMAELESDFPAMAKLVKAHQKLTAQLAQQAQESQASSQAAQQATKDEQDLSDQEQFDLGIAANPLIAKWMSEGAKGDSPEWNRAKQLDGLYAQDPAFASKTYAERLAVVQRLVCAEFGHTPPATSQAPAPAPATPSKQRTQPVVQEAPDPSLSDLGGVPPVNTRDPMDQLNTRDALAAAARMTDEELRRLAGVNY